MFKQKGQSALEYLMTYGWALVVIVVVIGVLGFLGVFNLGGTIESCTGMPSQFQYSAHRYKADGNFMLTFNNGSNYDVNVTALSVGGTSKTLSPAVQLAKGKAGTVGSGGYKTGTSGTSYKVDVTLTYDGLKDDGTIEPTQGAKKVTGVQCTGKYE